MENKNKMSFAHKLWYLANKEDVLCVVWVKNEDAIRLNMILLEKYLCSEDSIFSIKTASHFAKYLVCYGFISVITKSDPFGQNIIIKHKNFTRDGKKLDLITNSCSKKNIVDCERHNLHNDFGEFSMRPFVPNEFQGDDTIPCQFSEEQLKEFFGDDYSKVQKNEIKISSKQM
ncbi:uncharacterized protein LOC119673804 [Teleopsis dalmanni]|uniref:uncharacterized protein LOC119673804 n=1 Tax=Teleopsis dalmanni TaxID=139649 RepID=UPI000D32ADF5|nr:uncharacterized protein LOC119673804 [Teleopsis dalmanni]